MSLNQAVDEVEFTLLSYTDIFLNLRGKSICWFLADLKSPALVGMVENTGTGYTDIRIYGYRVYGYTGIRVYGYTGIRVYGYTGIRIYGYTGIRVQNFDI